MTGTRIKTLLIEDSGLMRIVLSDLLRKVQDIEVIATAMNGLEGIGAAADERHTTSHHIAKLIGSE
jgi:two-component system, chemotaxis family, protein-glutamate methylesterase/glutaminase